MRIHWLAGVGGILFGIMAAGIVAAAPPDEPAAAARDVVRELVHEALQREAYGLPAERSALLRQAVQLDRDAQLPHWYLGEIRAADGDWVPAGKVLDPRAGQLYREYRQMRDDTPDDAKGQKALADWCATRSLHQPARAHWLRSLAHDPDRAEVRQRLGLVRVGQQWYDPAALAAMKERARTLRETSDRWRPVFVRLAKQLSASSASKRKEAAEEIVGVKELFALPILQATVGSHSEEAQELVIRAVDRFPDALATELLAWQSVELPSAGLRKLAAERLAQREMSDYAPLMIAEMYSPVVVKAEVVKTGFGSVGLRHSFLREAMDHHELFVADTTIQTAVLVVSRKRPTQLVGSDARALQAAQTAIANTELAVDRQNQLTLDRNERISAALTIATGATVQPQPEAWWQWWMHTNEWTLLEGKGVSTRYSANTVGANLKPRKPGVPVVRVSCLAAGTPITTDQGLIAVEQIKAGDLVLARDIDSGELSYKPVLHTTIRPKKQLFRITAGKDTFEATGGHLFWVSGQGWTMTRELKPGMILHGAGAPVTVLRVEDGIVAETYNLVVADAANYFVGKEQILSHDNTPRQPTRMIVPGLAAE